LSSERRVYGFGIVGCGLGGAKHAQAIAQLENARLIAATGGSVERSRVFCDEHYCDLVADVGALVERSDVDVVSVCLPTARHAEVGVLVAQAGKHTLVEKPLCATQYHDIEVEDVAFAMIRFDSGAVGSVEVTTAAYPGFHERLEITGTSGTVALEGGELVFRELREEGDKAGAHGLLPGDRREKSRSGASDPSAITEDSHARQMSDFLDAIEVGHEPMVSSGDARATLELVLAIYESARANAPVCLPLPAGAGQERIATGFGPNSEGELCRTST
jgi:predicted dehydrogenase